jgi:hypothetical protein
MPAGYHTPALRCAHAKPGAVRRSPLQVRARAIQRAPLPWRAGRRLGRWRAAAGAPAEEDGVPGELVRGQQAAQHADCGLEHRGVIRPAREALRHAKP